MRPRISSALTSLLLGCVLAGGLPLSAAAEQPNRKLNVLILGDSLALCGFGKRLDERFRNHPDVNATFTYMACGTNPISWLKQKPYTNVKTQCGFWTIEPPGDGKAEPREMRDTYGIRRGQSPKAHLVPKFEDLLPVVQPDILIIQTGSNLFGLFPDAKTVRAAKDTSTLKKYLQPFVENVASPPSNVRKIYYVNPPTSGRVSKEVQDFVYQRVQEEIGKVATVIDSRKLVSYPYKQMEPDKEHFLGPQMDEWADKVFDIVQSDLESGRIAELPPLHARMPMFATAAAASPAPAEQPLKATAVEPPLKATAVERPLKATAVEQEGEQATTAAAEPPRPQASAEEPLLVEGRLLFKSEAMQVQELLPYRESLVSFVYEVRRVIRGQYSEQQILVMHPAHVGLKPQKLKKFKIGKRYKLGLQPLEGTLWDTAKMRDDSGEINLQPFIRIEDNRRHPGDSASAASSR
jgi:hypothetical protein